MKSIEVSKASKSLSDYAKELNEQILVITSNKKPIAALVSLKNIDEESLSLSSNSEFMEIIQAARAEIQSGKKLSLTEMKQAVLE